MKKPNYIYTYVTWDADDYQRTSFVKADNEREAFQLAHEESPDSVDMEIISVKRNETKREETDREYREMIARQKGTKTWIKQDQPRVR